MSTAYAPPPDTAYLTNTPFNMPTDDGDVWAVAITTSSSQFLNGAIAVAFTLIFPCQYLSLALYISLIPSPTRILTNMKRRDLGAHRSGGFVCGPEEVDTPPIGRPGNAVQRTGSLDGL